MCFIAQQLASAPLVVKEVTPYLLLPMSKDPMKMVVGCSSCSEADCPLSDANVKKCPEGHQVISGWKFSLACALVFVLPIGLAIFGSLMFSENKLYGFLGGLAGFVIGTLITTCVTRVCHIEKSHG